MLDGELDDDRLSFIGKLVKGSGDSIELGVLCRLDTYRHRHREGRETDGGRGRRGKGETEREEKGGREKGGKEKESRKVERF